MRHRVEWVGDDDQDGFGRLRHDLGNYVGHDLVVGVEQIVAAHARLAGNARGDDHDVGMRRGRVVVGAGHMHIAPFDRHCLQQVEGLALGNALHDVDQDNIGQFLGSDPVGRGGAYVAGAYNAYFLSHNAPCVWFTS